VAVDDVRARVRTSHEVEGEHDDGGPGEDRVDCVAVALELREPHASRALATDVHHLFRGDREVAVDVVSPEARVGESLFEHCPTHFGFTAEVRFRAPHAGQH